AACRQALVRRVPICANRACRLGNCPGFRGSQEGIGELNASLQFVTTDVGQVWYALVPVARIADAAGADGNTLSGDGVPQNWIERVSRKNWNGDAIGFGRDRLFGKRNKVFEVRSLGGDVVNLDFWVAFRKVGDCEFKPVYVGIVFPDV